MKLEFTLEIVPPTATAQEKKYAVVNGHLVAYDPKPVKDAKSLLMSSLKPFAPQVPLDGAIRLYCLWMWSSKSHKAGTFRTTKPDTDNLQKGLKDCMTKTGFWEDDAQVASETCEKFWGSTNGIYIRVEQITEGVKKNGEDETKT